MRDLTKLGQVSEITVDGGRTLRYLKAGSGKPLLLLHTIRTQLDYFQYVIPQLSARFTVYALDLPGHGYSSIDTTANYDEPYLRSGVASFIKKLDLKDLTLVGESIGGVLALTVASELPDRVISMVSSNPYDYDTRYGDGVRRGNFFANFIVGSLAIPVAGAIFAALENKLILAWIMRGGLRAKKSMPDDLLSEFNSVGRRKGYRHVERDVFANWRSWGEARSKYREVKAPVTLVYGDGDWSKPSERKRTADVLRTQIVTVKDTGHFAFVDRPEKMLEIISRSLAA
jgi:pimeloyl-ACP methyl ester carboxylesterase